MKRNQWRIAWGILVVLLLGYGGVLQLRHLRAGGPLALESPGVAYTWGGSPPAASITPDTGAFGILDPTTALNNLLIGAAVWEDIPSSSITLPNAGPENSITGPEGPGDFAVSNFMEFQGCNSSLPGISPMIFDNEDDDANGNGDIFDAMGLDSSVLGFAGPQCALGTEILEGWGVFNGPIADDPTGENFRSTVIHELGHFLNFGHSVVNGQALLALLVGGSDSQFPDGTPLLPQLDDIEIMFPFEIGQAVTTPHQDDIAIASTLYPDPNVPLSNFGTITGTLWDASSPRTGGQIIARNIANPLRDAVSAISGDFLQADTPGHPLRGTFTLNMLTPGAQYSLEVRDTISGAFSTPVFVDSGSPATPLLGPLPGPEEFYSGPTESTFDDPTAAPFLITVSSGGTPSASMADIFLNGIPTILLANFLNGNTDAFNSRIYLWNSSATPGSVAVRVFALPLLAGVPQELTDTPFSLGILGPKSALNLKLAEDILLPLGVPLPYIDNGGNLTLEFIIGSENVQGAAQVFTSGFAFGTYPLQEIR